MAELNDESVDIPEPETAVRPPERDVSQFDPGADAPPLPEAAPRLGEDPAYDPGGMGRQPDVAEEDEEHR